MNVHPKVRLLLLVLAIAFAVVAAGSGFDWFLTDHPLGWVGLALACGYASRLP